MSGFRIKLNRAAVHLKTLKEGIANDPHRHGHEIITKLEGKETFNLPEPDENISIIAGEVIYQIRSALDHLIFDLVKLNRKRITLPAKWDENCMFPIWTSLKGGQKPPLPYGAFNNLPGIPKDAHEIIDKVQPYNGTNGGARNSLRFLCGLSNIDKHRHLNLTRTRASVQQTWKWDNGMSGSSVESFDHGAEVRYLSHEMTESRLEVNRSTTLYVTFNEQEVLRDAVTVPIEDLLEQMLAFILCDIVFPLEGILKNGSLI